MNLPDKEFKIGDIVNIKSEHENRYWYISGKFVVMSHRLLFNYGKLLKNDDTHEIYEKDIHKLKDKRIYIHRWVVDLCLLNEANDTIFPSYSENFIEMDKEYNREKKIKELLNINE